MVSVKFGAYRKQEILSVIDEMEAKLLVEDEEQRQYQEVFEIKKYIYLEKFDKVVMATLMLSAEVVVEKRLNVVWKHQDIYEKIFSFCKQVMYNKGDCFYRNPERMKLCIYYRGDTHGRFERIEVFCRRFQTSNDDILIILGDAGINFSGAEYDSLKKGLMESLPITIFAIHGKHEQRPYTIDSYKEKLWHDGMVYYEEGYP